MWRAYNTYEPQLLRLGTYSWGEKEKKSQDLNLADDIRSTSLLRRYRQLKYYNSL